MGDYLSELFGKVAGLIVKDTLELRNLDLAGLLFRGGVRAHGPAAPVGKLKLVMWTLGLSGYCLSMGQTNSEANYRLCCFIVGSFFHQVLGSLLNNRDRPQ
jgi:hypothetical protein